jgi:hypothetical protein
MKVVGFLIFGQFLQGEVWTSVILPREEVTKM